MIPFMWMATLLAAWVAAQPAPGPSPVEVPLWKDEGVLPVHKHPESIEERSTRKDRPERWISYVSRPTLTFYAPARREVPGQAVLVIPGGGFRYVSIDKEGTEMARWLTGAGVAAAVLKYRVLDPEAERTPVTVEPLFADPERAIRVMRHHAAEWGIDASAIGVIGFSAGGTMAVRLVIDGDDGDPQSADPVERLPSRPSFVGVVYGGVPATLPKLSAPPPPFFIAHAADDSKAPVSVALRLFEYLRESGGTPEMHLFTRGDHGFGVVDDSGQPLPWARLYEAWLRSSTRCPSCAHDPGKR
jgi:acetyl esterase/lipase